jgi:hypothetical protein
MQNMPEKNLIAFKACYPLAPLKSLWPKQSFTFLPENTGLFTELVLISKYRIESYAPVFLIY